MIQQISHIYSSKKEVFFQKVQLYGLLLLPWALLFSEAFSSILVICISIPVLIFKDHISPKEVWKKYWPYFSIYFLLFVSGFWSADTERWLSLLRVNLPYLVMPVAFSIWPSFLEKHSSKILRQFIWAGAFLSVYIFFLVLSGAGADLGEGGYLPVPVHHVRTSLFLTVAVIAGWNQLILSKKRERVLYFGMVLLLLTGIHLLAVRTGIILVYISSVLLFFIHPDFRSGQRWIGIGMMLMVFVVIYLGAPTLSEKLKYWKEDWQNFDSYSWMHYSDAMRWKTNEIGWEIFLDHPLFGVGMGDVREEMTLQILQRENLYTEHYPHNFWITIMAGSGVVGFLIVNIALLFMGVQMWRAGPVWIVLYLVFLGSCLVETTLLSSLGVICFVFTTLLPGMSRPATLSE